MGEKEMNNHPVQTESEKNLEVQISIAEKRLLLCDKLDLWDEVVG